MLATFVKNLTSPAANSQPFRTDQFAFLDYYTRELSLSDGSNRLMLALALPGNRRDRRPPHLSLGWFSPFLLCLGTHEFEARRPVAGAAVTGEAVAFHPFQNF